MSKYVIFSLTLNRNAVPNNVNLCIEGKDSIEMKQVQNNSQNQVIIYEVSIKINILTKIYPNKIFYNYAINGAPIYEHNQQLLLAKKPLANNIYVNDTTEFKHENSQINVLFYIKPPLSDKKENVLYLKADAPVFIGNESQVDIIRMHQEGGYYLGNAIISVYLNQPVVYKYYISDQNGNELLREHGRMHTFFIHSAIPNKIISIYDIWNGSIPNLSFYPQVVIPHQTPSNFSTISFEYTTPEHNVKTVAVVGTNHFLNKPEPLFLEDCWRRVFQIPRDDVICNYSIGSSYNEGAASIDWSNAYRGDIVNPSDFVSSRILFEPNAFKKLVGVYIPLVSIRENPSQPVGDFKTLVSFAKWCNSVHVGCIHVHIEHLHHGLLDPIHADGISWPDEDEGDELNGFKSIYKFRKVTANGLKQDNVDPMNCSFHATHHGGLLIPEVRDAKIRVLYKRFMEWNKVGTDKSDFNQFLQCNEYIAKNCSGDFEKWVQFTLFNQLENAFQQIFETGVQLITDVTIINPTNHSGNHNTNDFNNSDNLNSSTNNNNNNDDDDDDDEIGTGSEISIHIDLNKNDDDDSNNDNENHDYVSDLINEIRIASHYSHGVMIVGLCPHIKQFNKSTKYKQPNPQQKIDIDFMKNLFGDIWQSVFEHFFRVSTFSISLLDNAIIPKKIQDFASKLNSGIREEFEKKMQMVIKILNEKNGSENDFVLNDFQNEVINHLSTIAPSVPSSLILDQMSCEVLGFEKVSKMNILPYSTIPIRLNSNDKMQCLGPILLSPEMVSEFQAQTQAEVIAEIIKQRISSEEQYVEIYFTDLLRALGYNTDIEPIQTIKDHCRFLLQFTIQDLFRESETSDRIRDLLSSSKRGLM